MSIGKRFRAFYHPEVFQGWGRHRKYFEGWYFKLVSRDKRHALALIPGIAFDESGDGHAFIQFLDGRNAMASYHTFDIDEFRADIERFEIRIGNNVFSEHRILIDLPDIQGELTFMGNVPWPVKWYSPGIMGPFAYAPFMECYHGIVSMNHELFGSLHYGNEQVSFEGGKGYTEKDWGRSFPEAYIWMQSNHFAKDRVSIKASVARIPWVTGAFTGFIAGIWLGDRLIRFTTYNGTKLKLSEVSNDVVNLVMRNNEHELTINAIRPLVKTKLASPIRGAMEGRIAESMTAELNVTIRKTADGTVVFQDTGVSGGLEVAGKIDLIARVID